jgi:hypothetical protein
MAFPQNPATAWQRTRGDTPQPEPNWQYIRGEICDWPSSKTECCVVVKVRQVYAELDAMDAAMAKAGVLRTSAKFQTVRLNHPDYMNNSVQIAGTGHTVRFELSDNDKRRKQQLAVVRMAMKSKPTESEYQNKRKIFLRVGGYSPELKTVIDIGPVHHPAHADDTRYNKHKAARQQSMLLKVTPKIRRTKR